ncbi:MAG: YHS domain-containing protein [Chloroherpetonaceae bacterium]|nr:YHS domain-containing protein [Chthonomonadaceae bacterium]MDW8208604.1 YHS domain-containing protein [Chloroherpetonaceae bacterium]
MNKGILLAAATLLVASTALASPDKGKKPSQRTTISCAVMKGDMVNIKEATARKMYADYKGNRYFFCCPGCKPKFEKNPEAYAKSDHIPTPKTGKPGRARS